MKNIGLLITINFICYCSNISIPIQYLNSMRKAINSIANKPLEVRYDQVGKHLLVLTADPQDSKKSLFILNRQGYNYRISKHIFLQNSVRSVRWAGESSVLLEEGSKSFKSFNGFTFWLLNLKNNRKIKIVEKVYSNIFISPNGTRIAYCDRQSNLHIADLNKGKTKPIRIVGKLNSFPFMHMGFGRWSPDGNSFAIFRIYQEKSSIHLYWSSDIEVINIDRNNIGHANEIHCDNDFSSYGIGWFNRTKILIADTTSYYPHVGMLIVYSLPVNINVDKSKKKILSLKYVPMDPVGISWLENGIVAFPINRLCSQYVIIQLSSKFLKHIIIKHGDDVIYYNFSKNGKHLAIINANILYIVNCNTGTEQSIKI